LSAILDAGHGGRRTGQRVGRISARGFGDCIGGGEVSIPFGANDTTDQAASRSTDETSLSNAVRNAALGIIGNLGSHVAHGLFQGFLKTLSDSAFYAASDHVLSADASSLRNQSFGQALANAADGLASVPQFAGNAKCAF
jgi:hypothetical protein